MPLQQIDQQLTFSICFTFLKLCSQIVFYLWSSSHTKTRGEKRQEQKVTLTKTEKYLCNTTFVPARDDPVDPTKPPPLCTTLTHLLLWICTISNDYEKHACTPKSAQLITLQYLCLIAKASVYPNKIALQQGLIRYRSNLPPTSLCFYTRW